MDKDRPIHSLEDIFNDPDAQELLVKKPVKSKSTYDPDVEYFKEITEWVKQHGGKEPEKTHDMSRLSERRMASRLKGFRYNEDKIELLKSYDELGLLKSTDDHVSLENKVKKEKQDFDSLDDILSDDSALFGDEGQTINSKLFDTRKLNAIKREQENKPENKSRRKQMADFPKYKALFGMVQAELASGKRKLLPFKSNQIELHKFYVLNGQLLYIESIGSEFENNTRSSSDIDARVHVIYENGT